MVFLELRKYKYINCIKTQRFTDLGEILVLGSSSRPLSSYGISDLVAKSCLTLVTHQAPLSMEFSRQEYWSGLLLPSPGDFPYPGIETSSLSSLTLAGGFFTVESPGKPH